MAGGDARTIEPLSMKMQKTAPGAAAAFRRMPEVRTTVRGGMTGAAATVACMGAGVAGRSTHAAQRTGGGSPSSVGAESSASIAGDVAVGTGLAGGSP